MTQVRSPKSKIKFSTSSDRISIKDKIALASNEIAEFLICVCLRSVYFYLLTRHYKLPSLEFSKSLTLSLLFSISLF